MNSEVLVLAAGKGSRLKFSGAKVLAPLAGRPLLYHILQTLKSVRLESKPFEKISIIVGHEAEKVQSVLERDLFEKNLHWVHQEQQLGTGHAVACALSGLSSERVLVVLGDTPLVQAYDLERFISEVPSDAIGILSMQVDNPAGYGRVVTDKKNLVESIVEHKDASESELKISRVNTGILLFNRKHLEQYLPLINNENEQNEYYLTSIIKEAQKDNVAVYAHDVSVPSYYMGINNLTHLEEAERIYQDIKAQQLLDAGVRLIDRTRIDIRGDISVAENCSIDANVILEGKVVIGPGCQIDAGVLLNNVTLGANVHIKPYSILESATIENDSTIGPFARLRPNTRIGSNVKVGNFVEIKNSYLDNGVRANHLTYLGDAEIGENVNIGAGTITCNYDGKNKFQTNIGSGSFIGSNSSLVAPLVVGENATIGAGSVITRNVDANTLTVSQPRQRILSSNKSNDADAERISN